MSDNEHPFQDHAAIITVIAMQAIVVYSDGGYDFWDFIISFLCFLFGIKVFAIGYSDRLSRILISANVGLSCTYSVVYGVFFLWGMASQDMSRYLFLQKPIERVIGLNESQIIALLKLDAKWIVNFLEPKILERILQIHVSEIASLFLIAIYIIVIPNQEIKVTIFTAVKKRIVEKMSDWRLKKFWWGIFFGALIGVLLLAPDSSFSHRIRDVFYTLQDSAVAVLDIASADPIKTILAFLVGAAIFGFLIACVDFLSLIPQTLKHVRSQNEHLRENCILAVHARASWA